MHHHRGLRSQNPVWVRNHGQHVKHVSGYSKVLIAVSAVLLILLYCSENTITNISFAGVAAAVLLGGWAARIWMKDVT